MEMTMAKMNAQATDERKGRTKGSQDDAGPSTPGETLSRKGSARD